MVKGAYRWERLSLNTVPRIKATRLDTAVIPTKNIGIIHNSCSFSGDREKATLLNRREGVNKDTLILLSCFCVLRSKIPTRASTLVDVSRHIARGASSVPAGEAKNKYFKNTLFDSSAWLPGVSHKAYREDGEQ